MLLLLGLLLKYFLICIIWLVYNILWTHRSGWSIKVRGPQILVLWNLQSFRILHAPLLRLTIGFLLHLIHSRIAASTHQSIHGLLVVSWIHLDSIDNLVIRVCFCHAHVGEHKCKLLKLLVDLIVWAWICISSLRVLHPIIHIWTQPFSIFATFLEEVHFPLTKTKIIICIKLYLLNNECGYI
jgi:hypothetical protein